MKMRGLGASRQKRLLAILLLAVFLMGFMYMVFVSLDLDMFASASESENLVQNLLRRKAQDRALKNSVLRDLYTKVEQMYPRDAESKFHAAVTTEDDALLRKLVFRRSTRYWYESKNTWNKGSVPLRDRFVTFEPWHGGFNNIRMSFEMAAAFAIASNRTLVLPPTQNMYLRGRSSLATYFDYEDLRRGISVVSHEEFLKLHGFDDSQRERLLKTLKRHGTRDFFKELAVAPAVYDMKNLMGGKIGGEVVFCFPDCENGHGGLKDAKHNRNEQKWFDHFAIRRRKYSGNHPDIVRAKSVHFGANLLGHFYAFIYFRDPLENRRVRRIIRDHIHFKEEIVEKAERIVSLLGDFQFSCLHVRRNDFQFEETLTPADKIVENTRGLFKPNETIYISTDEVDAGKHWSDPLFIVKGKPRHSWFEPMKKEFGHENVLFLSDFFDEYLKNDTDGKLIGCIESVICSRARIFVGTRKSTFSGYIHRLRGYMSDVGQKMILEAQSSYPGDYFETKMGPEWYLKKDAFGGGHPYWGREYIDAWENVYNPL